MIDNDFEGDVEEGIQMGLREGLLGREGSKRG